MLGEAGDWDLYVEEEPLKRLPARDRWDVDGIVVAFDDREKAHAVAGRRIPVVGFGGGHGWYDPQSQVPYFSTDNEAIGLLAAEHLLECGFSRLACYGSRASRGRHWTEDRIQAFRRRRRRPRERAPSSAGEAPRLNSGMPCRPGELAVWLRVGEAHRVAGMHRFACKACAAGLPDTRHPGARRRRGRWRGQRRDALRNDHPAFVEHRTRIATDRLRGPGGLARCMRGKKPRQIRHVIAPEGLVARQSTDVIACADQELGNRHSLHPSACLRSDRRYRRVGGGPGMLLKAGEKVPRHVRPDHPPGDRARAD